MRYFLLVQAGSRRGPQPLWRGLARGSLEAQIICSRSTDEAWPPCEEVSTLLCLRMDRMVQHSGSVGPCKKSLHVPVQLYSKSSGENADCCGL
jgi:hypothetical protein